MVSIKIEKGYFYDYRCFVYLDIPPVKLKSLAAFKFDLVKAQQFDMAAEMRDSVLTISLN